MKKVFAVLLTLVVLLTLSMLPAFAVEVEEGYDYTRFKDAGITLYVHNWGEYISDGSDGSLDINKAFEELTGIDVEYILYDTNEALYAKFASGGFEGDVIIPSDYMAARLIAEGYVQKLDYSNIPNYSRINSRFTGLGYDPANEYTVPYTWGVVGLIYNKTMVEETPDSWDALWDERYKGSILMFDNSRDAFGVSLLRLGYSVNTTNEDEIAQAAEQLMLQKPLVQSWVMDQIFDKMVSGEAAIAPYYSGDAFTMIADNPDLGFVIPKEGTNYFVDCMMIPAGAQNKEAAEMYINFMLETEVGLENTYYIGYATPNDAVYAELDDEIKNDPVVYQDEATLANTEVFELLPKATNDLMADYWGQVKTSGDSYLAIFLILGGLVVAAVVILIVRSVKHKKKEY